MSKRIWFVQQQSFGFMPLKAGLGMITEDELREYQDLMNSHPLTAVGCLCPKIYTTRTRRMSGEYQVVQGSRFKAKPLDPPIHFKVDVSYEIDFDTGMLLHNGIRVLFPCHDEVEYTFPELDLGIKGTTMKALHDELLRLNKKATVATPFYINKLEPITKEVTKIPKKDGTGPSSSSTGPRDGRGDGRGRAGKGTGSKTGGHKGTC